MLKLEDKQPHFTNQHVQTSIKLTKIVTAPDMPNCLFFLMKLSSMIYDFKQYFQNENELARFRCSQDS